MIDHRFAKSVLFVHSSLDDAGLTANEFRVYCHLARRSGNNGDAFPSAQTIADVCRMHKDTVWATLKSLTARGMLQRVPRPGLSTVYVLTTPDKWIATDTPPETEGCPSEPPTGNGGVGPTGNGGVGPTGNGGVLRISPEGSPPKSIPAEQRASAHTHEESGRIPASEWTTLKEHRDLCALRNVDHDLQLSRFRERNVGQLDTDQGWSVRFRQWLGTARPETRVSPNAVASPTMDEWIAFARTIQHTSEGIWPKDAAEAGWLENQAKGWRYVTDWKADCTARSKRWAANEKTISQRRRNER